MSSEPIRRRRHFARHWHRWLGLVAALPLLWLSITGLLLNHIVALGLNEKRVSVRWILEAYQQLPEGEPKAWKAGDRLVVGWDEAIFLDGKGVEGFEGTVTGAIGVRNHLIVATEELLGVFDGSDGMELELDELSLPALPLEKIGVRDQQLLVMAGGNWWIFSDDYLSFEQSTTPDSLATQHSLSGEELADLNDMITGRQAMPLDRVIGDAHSGKLFGWPGWLITDLTAVGTIILTLLGLRLFPKRRS